MELDKLNRLILDHLKHYEFELSSHLFHTELTTKKFKMKWNNSKLQDIFITGLKSFDSNQGRLETSNNLLKLTGNFLERKNQSSIENENSFDLKLNSSIFKSNNIQEYQDISNSFTISRSILEGDENSFLTNTSPKRLKINTNAKENASAKIDRSKRYHSPLENRAINPIFRANTPILNRKFRNIPTGRTLRHGLNLNPLKPIVDEKLINKSVNGIGSANEFYEPPKGRFERTNSLIPEYDNSILKNQNLFTSGLDRSIKASTKILEKLDANMNYEVGIDTFRPNFDGNVESRSNIDYPNKSNETIENSKSKKLPNNYSSQKYLNEKNDSVKVENEKIKEVYQKLIADQNFASNEILNKEGLKEFFKIQFGIESKELFEIFVSSTNIFKNYSIELESCMRMTLSLENTNPLVCAKYLFEILTVDTKKVNLLILFKILTIFSTSNLRDQIAVLRNSLIEIYDISNLKREILITYEDYLADIRGYKPLKKFL